MTGQSKAGKCRGVVLRCQRMIQDRKQGAVYSLYNSFFKFFDDSGDSNRGRHFLWISVFSLYISNTLPVTKACVSRWVIGDGAGDIRGSIGDESYPVRRPQRYTDVVRLLALKVIHRQRPDLPVDKSRRRG